MSGQTDELSGLSAHWFLKQGTGIFPLFLYFCVGIVLYYKYNATWHLLFAFVKFYML